jgi:hypothetical protein
MIVIAIVQKMKFMINCTAVVNMNALNFKNQNL